MWKIGQQYYIYSMLFADDQLLIAQDYEQMEYLTKLIEVYDIWRLKLKYEEN